MHTTTELKPQPLTVVFFNPPQPLTVVFYNPQVSVCLSMHRLIELLRSWPAHRSGGCCSGSLCALDAKGMRKAVALFVFLTGCSVADWKFKIFYPIGSARTVLGSTRAMSGHRIGTLAAVKLQLKECKQTSAVNWQLKMLSNIANQTGLIGRLVNIV